MLGERIKALFEASPLNIRDICKIVQISDPTYYRMLKSGEADTQVLRRIADYFKVPITYFFEEKPGEQTKNKSDLRILTVTVDKDKQERITYVPLRAAAGYMLNYQNVEFMAELPSFNLPWFTDGTYRAFEVEGDSMSPRIQARDIVVCRYVENWQHIRDMQVYVVVGKEGVGIVVKRVLNRLKEQQRLQLRSDNDYYPEYWIEASEIQEIWEVKAYLSTSLDPPVYAERFRRLEENMGAVLTLISKSITPK